MYTSSMIRRHILSLPSDKIFTTRELLVHGTRTAVDNTTFRLVQKGIIIRLARGVFILDTPAASLVTDFEIARAKGSAFSKKIYLNSYEICKMLDMKHLARPLNSRTFHGQGRTTSFDSIRGRITLKTISPRKLYMLHKAYGLVASALWHLGKFNSNRRLTTEVVSKILSRAEQDTLRKHVAIIPTWLARTFNWYGAVCWRGIPEPILP